MINLKEFNEDSFLYRYRSASDYNFDALLNDEIYASTPNILNDPLDCPITFDLDILYKKLIKKESFIKKYALQIFHNNKKDASNFESYSDYHKYISSLIIDACDKVINPENKQTVKDFINRIAIEIIFLVRECFGVVSFSLSCANSVMWSHYASNYKGFVLRYHLLSMNKNVYDVMNNNLYLKDFSEIYGLHKINYVPVEEIVDGTQLMYELISKKLTNKYENGNMLKCLATIKHKNILLSLLTTKDKSWEYEQEVRLIFPREDLIMNLHSVTGEKNAQFFRVARLYPPNGIIIGTNMSNIHKATIGYYCKMNNSVILQRINIDNLMSKRSLYLTLIKPDELI